MTEENTSAEEDRSAVYTEILNQVNIILNDNQELANRLIGKEEEAMVELLDALGTHFGEGFDRTEADGLIRMYMSSVTEQKDPILEVTEHMAACVLSMANLLPQPTTGDLRAIQAHQELVNNLNGLMRLLLRMGSKMVQPMTPETEPTHGQRKSGLIIP